MVSLLGVEGVKKEIEEKEKEVNRLKELLSLMEYSETFKEEERKFKELSADNVILKDVFLDESVVIANLEQEDVDKIKNIMMGILERRINATVERIAVRETVWGM